MRWIFLVLVCAGCYDPHLPPRDATGGDDDAASDPIDAGTDSPPPDAPPPCESACSVGTCEGNVCVIDCTAEGACPEDVFCPAGIPCRVVCGDSACAKKIRCELTTACEVQCTGAESCSDEIMCPVGDPCIVTCSGYESCDRRTKCKDSCACDVYCTGIGACDEVSECPDTGSCRLGNGCTSEPAGCDSCSG